jgi:hypothetical protein
VQRSIRQDEHDPGDFVREELPDALETYPEFKIENIVDDENKNRSAVQIREVEEVIRLLVELRRAEVNDRISQLRFLQTSAADDPEAKVEADPKLLIKLIQQRALLDRALSKPIRVE